MNKLNFIYEGGFSKRYHTVDTIKTQDIAAHSFGVAWLCELLTIGSASKDLIMAALAHDLAEHIVGDIPSPSKRAMNISELFRDEEEKHLAKVGLSHYAGRLTDAEVRTLKFADCMDGVLFCIRERRLGNRAVDIVYERFCSYMCELRPFSEIENELFKQVTSTMED